MKSRRSLRRRLLVEQLETRVVPSHSHLATLSYSTNWSGYAVTTASTVQDVKGGWTVPTIVLGQTTAYSAQWLGIDGFSSNTVEQIGTEADIINGVPTYYAWYEMYPAGFVTVPIAVSPGNSITAEVSAGGGGSFNLTITNVSTTQTYTTTQTLSSAKLSSAEWVVEAPSAGGVLPLANTGTTNFTGAQTTISGTTGPIDNSAWASGVNQINMVSRRGVTEDSTSSLTDSGSPTTSAFSVAFVPQSSTAPPGHHGKGPTKSPDVPVITINPFGAGSAAAPMVVTGPEAGTSQFVPSSFHSSSSVQLGYGVSRFEFYLLGETTDQSDTDALLNPGDAIPGVPPQLQVSPAAQTPATPAQPRQDSRPQQYAPPQHKVQPPGLDGQMAGAEQARWLSAVDKVFAMDFGGHQDDLPSPPVWTGVEQHEAQSLAVALVLGGAVLAFQKEQLAPKSRLAKKSDQARDVVIW